MEFMVNPCQKNLAVYLTIGKAGHRIECQKNSVVYLTHLPPVIGHPVPRVPTHRILFMKQRAQNECLVYERLQG